MNEGKTKIIAVVNQKGGVGKTTTVANLGYILGKQGKKVLLIDWDSQASLTGYFNVGLSEEEFLSSYEAAVKELRGIDAEEDERLSVMSLAEILNEAICRPIYASGSIKTVNGTRKYVPEDMEFGIDLLPTKLELSDYELELGGDLATARAFHLSSMIDVILENREYDYILIDCNPSLGFLTMNALVAATDGVIIPTNMDVMSIRGVKNLIERITEVQEFLLYRGIIHMGVIGIVLNLYADRRTVDNSIKDDMNRFYPFRIFENTIPESVNAKKATLSGLTYSQMYQKAEEAYTRLAGEIEERLKEMETEGQKIQQIEKRPKPEDFSQVE